MSLTIHNFLGAVVIGTLAMFAGSASTAAEHSSLASSFPERVGSFTRISVKKNEAAIHGEVIDAAVAKYAAGASEIEWSGTEFATSDQAFAALEGMINSYPKEGVGISSVKNVAGKVRYAVIELPHGIVCCWVNKRRQRFFFVVTGKLPEIETFMRLQTTW
jgi:hypothetical protein